MSKQKKNQGGNPLSFHFPLPHVFFLTCVFSWKKKHSLQHVFNLSQLQRSECRALHISLPRCAAVAVQLCSPLPAHSKPPGAVTWESQHPPCPMYLPGTPGCQFPNWSHFPQPQLSCCPMFFLIQAE